VPANATGTITVTVPVVGLAAYDYSLQDDYAACEEIPAGGTTLRLPAEANSGDSYGFGDVDGSCSGSNPIIVSAPAGTTIRGGATFSVTNAYASGRVRFNGTNDSWVVTELTGGSSGSGVTWSADLAGSTNTVQRVVALSGATLIPLLNEGEAGATIAALGVEVSGGLDVLYLFTPTGGVPTENNWTLGGDGVNAFINAPSGFVQFAQGRTTAMAALSPTFFDLVPPIGGGTPGSPLFEQDSEVTLVNAGNYDLTASQQQTPSLTVEAISLTNPTTLTFSTTATFGGAPGTAAAFFDLDCTNVVTNGHSFTLVNGAGSINIAPYFAGGNQQLVFRIKCQNNTIGFG
jgi:hypothetical protein